MQALFDAIAQADIAPNNRAARRLFHGRGGLYPGCEHLALDWYPPAWLLTSFSPLAPDTLKALDEAIVARSTALGLSTTVCWVYQCRDQGRAETVVMRGNLPAPHVVTEGGSAFVVNVAKGQNHGLFLDMANGRQWLRENMITKPGARVLNLFAYTCAFSVVAKQAGAAEVINLDMSDSALRIGQQNHQLNACAEGVRFMAHDLFKSWGKVKRFAPYDTIVADPPSYQKGSFVATKDYERLLRHLPNLCADGTDVLLCLNAPELSMSYLQSLVATHAPALSWVGRVENPETFKDCSSDRALKVLHYTFRTRT